MESAAVSDDDAAVIVAYNRTRLPHLADLLDVIRAAGFTAGLPAESGQLGRPITIPPAVS